MSQKLIPLLTSTDSLLEIYFVIDSIPNFYFLFLASEGRTEKAGTREENFKEIRKMLKEGERGESYGCSDVLAEEFARSAARRHCKEAEERWSCSISF